MIGFKKIDYLKHKLEKVTYLVDVMNSVSDETFSKKPICNVL